MQTFKKLTIYISKQTDIFKNLATERYLYKSLKTHPILFFYQNDKSIIIGRNQNQHKECKLEALKAEKISLCRRYSGGGAVYQDLGNLCFSFITPIFNKKTLPLDMKENHNKILIKAFKNLKIPISAEGRNDLILGKKKFSGSAFELDLGGKEGIAKVLHHGTILFDTDLGVMKRLLNPSVLKLKSKGVESVKGRVVNLREVYPDLEIDQVIESVKKEFFLFFGKENFEKEILFVDEPFFNGNQSVRKYYEEISDGNWILEKCPEFSNNFETRFDWGILDLFLEVRKGRIVDCKLFSDSLFPNFIDKIEEVVRNGGFEYSLESARKIEEVLLENFDEENLRGFSRDFCRWFGQCVQG